MINENKSEDVSTKIQVALNKAIEQVKAETKAKNSFFVYSNNKGNIIKIAGKDV